MQKELERYLRTQYREYDSILNGEDEVPEICHFTNSERGYCLIDRILEKKSEAKVGVHCDVDMDGIGSGYIMYRFLKHYGIEPILMINKVKQHSVTDKYIEPINGLGLDLLIVLDSSTNECEVLSKFNCPVLVIDHHNITNTSRGDNTVLINSTVDYGDSMSCGLVVYEFIRAYLSHKGMYNWVYDAKLYQWAVVTLYSDVITLDTKRNQYYLNKAVYAGDIEPDLGEVLFQINAYDNSINKSTVNFKLAPIVNKAIRAGDSVKVLEYIIKDPSKAYKLMQGKYSECQKEAIAKATGQEVYGRIAFIDMTDTGVASAYNGVIAGQARSKSDLSTFVYSRDGDSIVGSFRGKQGVKYYTALQEYLEQRHSGEDYYVGGHQAAFGYKLPVAELEQIGNLLTKVEEEVGIGWKITLGKGVQQGELHITEEELEEFKREHSLYELGVMNVKLSTAEQIQLVVSNNDFTYTEEQTSYSGKLKYRYDIYGIQCLAFNRLEGNRIFIYPELTVNGLEVYAKELN